MEIYIESIASKFLKLLDTEVNNFYSHIQIDNEFAQAIVFGFGVAISCDKGKILGKYIRGFRMTLFYSYHQK